MISDCRVWLVVCIPTPLKNIWVKVNWDDDYSQKIDGKRNFMFQSPPTSGSVYDSTWWKGVRHGTLIYHNQLPRNSQDKEEDDHLSTGLSDIDPSLDVRVAIVYVEIDKVYTGLYKHRRFCWDIVRIIKYTASTCAMPQSRSELLSDIVRTFRNPHSWDPYNTLQLSSIWLLDGWETLSN